MSAYGVGVEHLRVSDDQPTGRAFIQVAAPTGENAIVLLHGANHAPSFALPPLGSSAYSHALLQNEVPFGQTCAALRAAKRAGLVTVWNPSPVPAPEQAARGDPWGSVDWLVVNEAEAEALLAARAPERARAAGEEPEAVSRGLVAAGAAARGIVTTLGARGALASMQDRPAGEEEEVWVTFAVPPGCVEGKVKDTTGAGDCFTGYFVAQLLKLPTQPSRSQVAEALHIAGQAAAMCVESEGTMDSYQPAEAVRQRMEAAGRTWPEWA